MRVSAFNRGRALVLGLAFAALVPAEVHAVASWWDTDWGARRKITFQNSARSGSLSNFPVLICLTSSEVDYSKTQNSGQDLRFVDSNDSTLLNHEIEQWNESGTSYVWVKIPTLDASDTDFIYMYYDNSGASAPSTASQEATWSNSFESVYHFHSNLADSSGTKSAATNEGTTNGTSPRLAGNHRVFDGANDFINTNWTPDYGSNVDFTWEGWFRTDNTIARSNDILGIEDRFSGAGDDSEIRFAVRENDTGTGNPVDAWDVLLWTNSAKTYTNGSALTVSTNVWHHAVLVRDGSTARTYIDGSQVHSGSVNTGTLTFPTRSPWTTTNRLLIGAQWNTDASDAGTRNEYEGELDEIRTSKTVARSADWVAATYDTTKNCSSFSDITQETTEVGLVSFAAEAGDEEVELVWQTGSELQNHGFHLYRAVEEDGEYTRITSHVIPGLGSSPEGARYSYLDPGLTNGETYYYKLEDIDRTDAVEVHGPVSATPVAGVYGGEEAGEVEGTETSRVTYGRPWENEVRMRRIGNRAAVLELVTEGFYAYPEEDGTVRLEVPGLELMAEPGEPAVSVYQGWIEAVVGRRIKLGRVRVDNVQEFTGLRPSWADAPDLIASGDGTA